MDERCLRAARYVELAKDKAARTQDFARATELKEAEDALREFAVRDGKLKATLKSSVCAADFGAAAQVQRDLDQRGVRFDPVFFARHSRNRRDLVINRCIRREDIYRGVFGQLSLPPNVDELGVESGQSGHHLIGL